MGNFGFGDNYWIKVIYNDCLGFCKKNNIKFSVDPSITKEGAAGMFIYRTKENMVALKKNIDDYNECIKSLRALGKKDEEYKPEPDAQLEIKLDGDKLTRNSQWLTFLHEIGHYLMYRDNIKQSERKANHYRLQYFKNKPKWIAWQFRNMLHIYADVEQPITKKYLELQF